MKTIEISTTQNVTIEYNIATVMDRFLGYLIDAAIIIVSILVFYFFYRTVFNFHSGEHFRYFVSLPIFFFYTLFSEIFMDGQTIGKKALNIKVVKINGKEPTLSDYLVRWTLRMVDIYLSFGTVAALTISSSNLGQRLGDLLSGTILIKLKPSVSLRLNDILNIQSIKSYQPQFPQVKHYSEEDMLLIKHVIDQVKKYPNQAHESALDEMVQRIREQLNIEEEPGDQLKFLRTLLNDYIVLTR